MTAASFELVAHRGHPARAPENTLAGVTAALEARTRFLEVDVQITRDGTPVLYHDETLERTSGRSGRIVDLDTEEAIALPAGEPARFGDAFSHERVPTLARVCELLATHPRCHTFFEIKPESVAVHGAETATAAVTRIVRATVSDRATIISFDGSVLDHARTAALPIGWILRGYDDAHLSTARQLSPEVLFCNVKRIPAGDTPLWPGAWRWAIYDVTDLSEARAWAARGADLVETMAIRAMLQAMADAAPDASSNGE